MKGGRKVYAYKMQSQKLYRVKEIKGCIDGICRNVMIITMNMANVYHSRWMKILTTWRELEILGKQKRGKK